MNGKNKINSSFFQNKIWHSEIMFNYLNKNINNEKSLNAITEYQQYLNLYFIHAYANNLGKYHAYNYNFRHTDSYFKKYFMFIGNKYLDDVEKLYKGEELQVFRLIKNDIEIFREDIDPVTIGKMSDLVFECRDLLSHNMQYYFLARLNNICLLMNAKGKPGYKKILFENYKFIFDSGLYFSDGRSTITISEYTGILLSALKVQEFDWAEKFINTCKANNYLKNPDNISLYGLSFLSFYKGEFQKCINYCNRVNLNLFPLRMGMNKINMKSMYELGHFDEAKSFIINYKQYLTKNKSMSKTVFLREINFLEYYLTLIKNVRTADKKYLNNIIKKLEPEINVADKEWLLSKLKQSPHQIL